jgi:hypothetical protein
MERDVQGVTAATGAGARPRRRAILVPGMGRSGTSAISRVLNLLGAAIPGAVMPPQPDNPTGFWEPLDVVDLHDRMLAAIGLPWHAIVETPEAWFQTEPARAFGGEIRALLERHAADDDLLLIKDPRANRFLPLWTAALAALDIEPLFVIPIRNPLEVAGSLAARDGLATPYSCLVWLRAMLEAERHTRGYRRSFVDYAALLSDWRATISGHRPAESARRHRAADRRLPGPDPPASRLDARGVGATGGRARGRQARLRRLAGNRA